MSPLPARKKALRQFPAGAKPENYVRAVDINAMLDALTGYGQRLCVYYGTPQGVNGLWLTEPAAQTLAAYDYLVLGDGLEDPANPNYTTTVATVARVKALHPTIRIFGYVDLSVTYQNLPIAQIQAKAVQWQTTGATDIFLDDFGYDFHVSRTRQNAAVDVVHGLGMGVTANAWQLDDACGSAVNATYNTAGTPPHLDSRDCLLLESWVVNTGSYSGSGGWEPTSDVKTRGDQAIAYRSSLGIKILGVGCVDWTTTSGAQQSAFFRVLEGMAKAYSLDGYGLASYQYSAVAPNVNVLKRLPFASDYSRAFSPGTPYIIDGTWTKFSRWDLGITVDMAAHTVTVDGVS